MKTDSSETKQCWKTEAIIQTLVAYIDEVVTLQLSTIIQHASYKKLESLWRGLWLLLEATPSHDMGQVIRVRILDWTWDDVSGDLEQNDIVSNSVLYRLVCQQEFNTLGGHPFGLLVVDHAVRVMPDPTSFADDLEVLQRLAELGHEALCPVLLPVAPDFLGTSEIDVWVDQERVKRILDSEDFVGWRRLREHTSSLFLGLTLPDILLRPPWQHCYQKLHFNELATDGSSSHYLWGNSAFALAGTVMAEFSRIRWFGFLRDPESGGAIINNPSTLAARLHLTDKLEFFFSDMGFIPLSTCYLSHDLAFFNNQSVYAPPNETEEWRLLCMLQTTLTGCRFGHYLKVLIRENIGSYQTSSACERDLNAWLQGYVSNVDYADDELLAKCPLKHAVAKVRGNPDLGVYFCQIEILPQYQFDTINAHIVLTTNTSELAAGLHANNGPKPHAQVDTDEH